MKKLLEQKREPLPVGQRPKQKPVGGLLFVRGKEIPPSRRETGPKQGLFFKNQRVV